VTTVTTIFQKFEKNILIESDHFGDEVTAVTAFFQKFEKIF
jgi:hypothetical protein